jgi:hypothetical protein
MFDVILLFFLIPWKALIDRTANENKSFWCMVSCCLEWKWLDVYIGNGDFLAVFVFSVIAVSSNIFSRKTEQIVSSILVQCLDDMLCKLGHMPDFNPYSLMQSFTIERRNRPSIEVTAIRRCTAGFLFAQSFILKKIQLEEFHFCLTSIDIDFRVNHKGWEPVCS